MGEPQLRLLPTRSAALVGILVLVSLSHAALADAGLTMPFACHVNQGRVALIPTPLQTYRIYGTPEQRMFTACSPNRPGGCPSWNLQRFDLDCGGVRVSWLAVVEAMTQWTHNPARVSDGRLYMMSGPRFRAAPGPGPCRMGGAFAYYHGRFGPPGMPWPCAQPWAQVPQPAIALPPGFAPAMARFVRFLPGTPPTPVAQIDREAPKPSPTVNAAHESTGSVPRAEGSNAAKPRETVSSGKTLDVTNDKPTKIAEAQPRIDGDRAPAISAREISAELNQTQSLPATRDLLKVWALQIGLALIALALIGATLLASNRRLQGASLSAFAGSDVAGLRSAPREEIRPLPEAERVTREAPRASSDTSDPLPLSRSEALRVLGASPEAGKDVLKKIVKRLRQAWHPDLAKHEDDRRIREHKLKQINVAWDIISGKRAPRSR